MANPTTAFGWVMPNSADLVTDLPADFNVFGQGVDTSMQYLLGGTTGQVLSKTSATDMAFTWIANDVGDITGVTAGTGISGGGTSGTVTVTNSMATAITTNGDVIYGTGSGTFSRLGIGSAAQVLTVAAGIPSWATAATSGMTLITSASFASSSAVNINNCFSATYQNYKIVVNFTGADANRDVKFRLRVSSTDASGANYSFGSMGMRSDGASTFNTSANNATSLDFCRANSSGKTSASFEIFRPFAAATTQFLGRYAGDDNTSPFFNDLGGLHTLTTSYDGLTIFPTAGNITGDYYIYGFKN